MTTAAISLPALPNPLEDGWTLPASWYTDLAVQERERERLFARAWTYAGPAEWVSEPGSYFSAHIGHVPVAVVRGTDGTLRGLVNVCRHRGHLVVDGTGCRETLQCPYHAWTYELDGTLRKAPRAEREPGFDPEGLSLAPVSVGTLGAVRLREPGRPRRAAGSCARTAPGDRRGERPRPRRDPLPLAQRVADRGQLESRHGELPRVLPLPHGASGVQQGHRRSPDAYALQAHATFSSQIGPVRQSALAGNGKAAYTPLGDVVQAQYHFSSRRRR